MLFALHELETERPDLVVAGINAGPNLAEFVTVSGTVNAALTAASLGVPAIAASQGLAPTMDYAAAARFVGDLVRRFRRSARLRADMTRGRAIVLNVNFPACAPGAVRGVRVVPLGRLTRITGYTAAGTSGQYTSWTPSVVMGDVSISDSRSTLIAPADDIEAFNNGFASVTPLAPDLGLAPPFDRFRALER